MLKLLENGAQENWLHLSASQTGLQSTDWQVPAINSTRSRPAPTPPLLFLSSFSTFKKFVVCVYFKSEPSNEYPC